MQLSTSDSEHVHFWSLCPVPLLECAVWVPAQLLHTKCPRGTENYPNFVLFEIQPKCVTFSQNCRIVGKKLKCRISRTIAGLLTRCFCDR